MDRGFGRRAWGYRAVLALVSAAIGVAAAEAAYRTLLARRKPARSEREFRRDIVSRWPRPVSPDKPAGAFRIVGLCDSFGVVGDAGNFHYLLEDVLRELGHAAHVVNLSQSFLSPGHELLLMRRFARRYGPDLVLQGLVVGNDFTDRREPFLEDRGIPVFAGEGWAGALKLPVRIRRGWAASHSAASDGKRPSQEPGFTNEAFLRIVRRRMELCRAGPPLPQWAQVTEDLASASEEARRMGASYVLVLHPDQYQVEKGLMKELREAFSLDPAL